MNEPIKSVSPITGKAYSMPIGKDTTALSEFIHANQHKEIVAVQGLGFVGAAMSLVVANSDAAEYAVIGLDQKKSDSYWKIAEINLGLCPIISSDPLVLDLFEKSKKNRNFYATYDTDSFAFAEVIIVDINLDVNKFTNEFGDLVSFDVPLSGFKKAIESIGKVCREDVLILIETTVPPGTCRKIVHPILVECLMARGLSSKNIKLGHSYERVMPGPNYINSIKNFYRVYSGIDEDSANAVEKFLKTIISVENFPLTRLKTTEATEMAKVLENSYRAMNISFSIEWSRFAELSGVDLFEVVDAIRLRPTHANLMYPGIGVGGYCLTKDPLMASWASQNFFGLTSGLQSSVNAVKLNDEMPKYCFNFVETILKNHGKETTRIGLLGVAYGPGIGDTRFSPVEGFYKMLSRCFDNIFCHDPYVNMWAELELNVENSLQLFFENTLDVLIITTGHKSYLESENIYQLIANMKKNLIVIDTVGLLNIKEMPSQYEQGVNFFTLGVGNNKETK